MRNVSQQNGQVKWVQEAFSKPPEKPKGWVTIADIVAQTGNGRKTVESRIKEMLDNGLIEVMDCTDNKRRVKCYRQKSNK